MRIISQDGMIDMPYENIGIRINNQNEKEVIAFSTKPFNKDDYFVMAEYSKEEKAINALEMLNQAQCGVVYMKHGDYEIENIDLSQEIEKKIEEEMKKPHFLDVRLNNPVIECKVFRFPADDEVEV